jgi:uncharacterized membrane protein YcaP (DUF421 family)
MNLCQYKNLFGAPRTGVHSYRISIVDVATIDLLMTVGVAYIISKYAFDKDTKKTNYPFWITFLIIFIIGIIAHRLFCVRTTVDKFLFPNS